MIGFVMLIGAAIFCSVIGFAGGWVMRGWHEEQLEERR
jgi:hypothetical protein